MGRYLREFTGWHMAAIMVAFFGTVIAVNVTMARIAIGSFGGVVVENSYVASQNFNGWLEQERSQQALGWEVAQELLPDGRVQVRVAGAPEGLAVIATARQPLGATPDVPLTFARQQDGSWISREALADDRWVLRLALAAGGASWRGQGEL